MSVLKNIRGMSKEKIWDYENSFYWFSSPTRINKMLMQFELYKSIIKLPGEIIECGVYKASSLIRLATFRNLLENDFSRKILGFDAFGKFPSQNLLLESDLEFVEYFESSGGFGLEESEVEAILADKGFKNIFLRKGSVFDTLPAYLDEYPETKISFLHLDMDVKEPTLFALDLLYDRVVPNGIIVFDDYGTIAGETEAVDEFIQKKRLVLEKLTFYKTSSFIRKIYC
jgi:hypothetical protein